jgi:adenine-specific DNA-methyltransferase
MEGFDGPGMSIEKLTPTTPDLTKQNVQRLAELFPECVTEGPWGTASDDGGPVIDFDLLRQALSNHIVEGPQERYRLDWPGKRQALLTANTPIDKTLRPMREDSVDFDTTRNIFIEGDNLDALKLLQETYLGKVKMIYIDPPYNTGKDFIYKDNFAQSREAYETASGQRDDGGGRLVANPETNGRFHSDWLSMMYPRLKLARNLLRDDGIILVSIDDNEQASLIKICDEVFGDAGFVGCFVWSKKRKGSFLSKTVVSLTEYIVAYARSPGIRLFGGSADEDESQPLIKRTNSRKVLTFPTNSIWTKLPDGILPKGAYGKGTSAVQLLDDATISQGKVTSSIRIDAPFVWSQANLDRQIAAGCRLIINTLNLQVRAFKAHDEDASKGLSSLIDGVAIGATNEDGYEELERLIGVAGAMDYPKPSSLMEYVIGAACHWDQAPIVMDFFAGSGALAHGAIRYAVTTNSSVQSISVQLAEELTDDSIGKEAGYSDIAQLSRERIRRAGAKMLADRPELKGKLDVGFRAFRIDSGSLLDVAVTPQAATQAALSGMISHIKDDRSDEDLLFGALLNWGVDITLPVAKRELLGRTIWLVDPPASGDTGAALIACFARPMDGKGGIDTELADALASLAPLRVLFRDDGFASDAAKENVASRLKQRAPDTAVRVL